MGLLSSKIREEQLKPGDHIYTWRRGCLYSHHGIYVGEGNVMHLTRAPGLVVFSSSSLSRPSGDQDRVVSCSIEEFLSGGDLNIYEYGVKLALFLVKRGGTCSLANSDPPEDVLHRASILLEKGFGDYHLFQNNCEDLAIYCKTGLLKVNMSKPDGSEQIKLLFATFVAITCVPYRFVSTSVACQALVVCGLTCGFRLVRRDVEKVDIERIEYVSYHRGRSTTLRIKEGGGTRWFLPAGEYVAHAFNILNPWSWTPTSRFFLWIRFFALYDSLNVFVANHLRNHGLKLTNMWRILYGYLGIGTGVVQRIRFSYGLN